MASSIIITLPFPPSVNGLYATDFRTKRRYKTKAYEAWLVEAYAALLQQPRKKFIGPVSIRYTFGRPDKRKRDLSNLFKACDDFLVIQQIIVDDSDIHEIHAVWGNVVGAQLEIIGLAD